MVNSVGLRDSLEIKESFDYYTEVRRSRHKVTGLQGI